MPTNPACVPAIGALTGLAGWWKLDETVIGTAADSSGNGNDASYHGSSADDEAGAPPVACDGGLSFRYGANNAYHYVPGTTSLDITGPLTILAWANYPYDDIEEGIASKGHAYALTKLGSGGAAGMPGTANRLAMTVEKASTATTVVAAGTSVIATDTDYFFAGVYDGTDIKLYVNGALESTTACGVAPEATGEWFQIGFDSIGLSATWARLDSVAVVDGALSGPQIAALYAACRCATGRQRTWAALLA